MKSLFEYGRKLYFAVLIAGIVGSVVLFNTGYELEAAVVTAVAVVSLLLIGRKSTKPIFDERDTALAEESTHAAVMWSGAFGGVAMIVISIGIGLGRWSYPDWAAPYYLSWGAIISLAALIEVLKRYRVIE
ncbi:hypothetical protein [Candidatus Nanohalococcus occultus]|uniref:DUF2178 domain-containing protein n=1 Tax=Candidatus Nanohalococcus occultus TaxID=2978047 RepID=A0ABY8CDT9_9ARCH|nr:hypothetical protein SVXNc_0356 [Candidatus Nanohaloarchaeota archaeon SVXNc]